MISARLNSWAAAGLKTRTNRALRSASNPAPLPSVAAGRKQQGELPPPPLLLWQAFNLIHSLSEPSKMPCFAYGLAAAQCHRGSKLRRLSNSVCSHCYAMRGNYQAPAVLNAHAARAAAMDNPRWSEAMAIVISAFEPSGHFRWFDSGDLRSLSDLLKIVDVARRTPHIKHWLPTHEFGILAAFKRSGGKYPPNLTVRLSADLVDRPIPLAIVKSTGAHGIGLVASDHAKATCPAHTQNNRCLSCRQCWDRSVKSVTYPLK